MVICSWLVKWPLRSQKFGRRRRRFFVLRDNLLTYYTHKPSMQSTWSHGNIGNATNTQRGSGRGSADEHGIHTITITDDTTVSYGRRFFQKCLLLTTPMDSLYIHINRELENRENNLVTRWLQELTKAIQAHQKRKDIVASLR